MRAARRLANARCLSIRAQRFLKLARARGLHDGSTLLVAALQGERLYVANAGDCRAVLVAVPPRSATSAEQWWRAQPACSGADSEPCGTAPTAVALSEDHKPDLARELERIGRAGGHVLRVHGTPRVQGVLSVARSLGDVDLKAYVVAQPDVCRHVFGGSELALLLASDGVCSGRCCGAALGDGE
jgi:serine/threonine protein phosphatase PrpC